MLLQTRMKRSLKKLASKVKGINVNNNGSSHGRGRGGGRSSSPEVQESLSGGSVRSYESETSFKAKGGDKNSSSIFLGYFAVYVGEERRRFMVKTSYLIHPLFKMLLEKASNEFGFEKRDVLVIPCSVLAFQEALNAIQRFDGRFDFGELVEEFL